MTSEPLKPSTHKAQRDKVYASLQDAVAPFEFNDEVAQVFDDMILRSVPGYTLSIDLITLIAERYGQPNTKLFDLGCSSGVATRALSEAAPESAEIIGIDNSPAMIAQCRQSLSDLIARNRVSLQCQNLTEAPLAGASVIVLNYTLQFLPLIDRDRLLAEIFEALTPGGVVFLAEKVVHEDTFCQSELEAMHLAFKKRQGYSALEIAQKRAALESVLIPETEQKHLDRLAAAGFSHAATLLRAINFIALVGWKQAA